MNQENIVIRFYKDFLAAYKPQMRERRGVSYKEVCPDGNKDENVFDIQQGVSINLMLKWLMSV